MGRLLEQCMSVFSSDDMAVLEALISSNFEDALMVSSLSKLQQHQMKISERLNTVFADSVLKSQLPPTTSPAPTSTQKPGKDAK